MKPPLAPPRSAVPVWSPWKRSGQPATLGVELFSTRADAEAKLHYWEGRGIRNLWLHEVQKVEISDRPASSPDGDTSPRAPAGPVFALVRVG
jgi:hypothetical protein